NIVRLDEQGSYIESTVYDTFESPDADDDMVRYLENLSNGEIVIFALRDEASDNLNSQARSALEDLGSEYIGQLGHQDSWGMISVVGQGKLAEDYQPSSEGPAMARLASKMTLHTNFKINKDGEFLGLYAPDGTEIDSGKFVSQVRDVSFGRQPDGGEGWCLFSEPTPSAPNDTACATGIAEPPEPSTSSGFYEGPITVTLSAMPEEVAIYYTLDGSIPTEASPRYIDPLVIDRTQVLRARVFAEGLIPSPIMTHTYLIDEEVHLPVLSLVTNPENLWDEEMGIYAEGRFPVHPNYKQRGREWERPVWLEFFEEDGFLGFALDAGIRIHGGFSRELPKKSFRLHFRRRYGQEHINYPVFHGAKLDVFRTLVVRNAGDDGYGGMARLRDPLAHVLWAEEDGLTSAKRSVFVFLNGTPWGIYNLREHIDQDYLTSNYGVKEADLLIGPRTIELGDAEKWDATLSFFENYDLGSDKNLIRAESLIDIENFTDYEIFQIYTGNMDVLGPNYIRFRPRSPDGKWRWIMWDIDTGFGDIDTSSEFGTSNPASHNTLAWATRDGPRHDLGPDWDDGGYTLWSALILRKLLENDEYRLYFINRFADLLNTTLHPENVIARIDALAAIIKTDIPQEMARWSNEWEGSPEEWLTNIEGLRDFARRRPHYVRHHIVDQFELVGTATLVIEPPERGKGSVRVNGVLPMAYPWHGTYFQGVPVTLQAEPAPDYRFTDWSDSSLPKSSTVVISLPEYYDIQAVFMPDETFMPGISK
ncbi:CotH kinase family protein, partial [Candidatus Bipolaricaulota bacterium]|nr:CotH kinase family protein [Candidatus Bipolaricaulota bacterium]